MLTDLIIATEADAQAILNAQGHASVWPTLEAKSVDQIKLASLRFILKGQSLDDALVIEYVKTFEPLVDGGEEGPWIDALPNDLVHLLAAMPVADLAKVAAAWANTDEARLDRWVASDVEQGLGELSAIAASAVAQGKRLLLWICP